jgi:hypothetical protein
MISETTAFFSSWVGSANKLPSVDVPNITLGNFADDVKGDIRHVNAKRRAVGAPPLVAISISFSTASSALEQVFQKEEEENGIQPLPAQAKGAYQKKREAKRPPPRGDHPLGTRNTPPKLKKKTPKKKRKPSDHFALLYTTPTF